MSIDKLILAGVRGSDPETGMNTFHEFLCVRASDYDEALARIAALEADLAKVTAQRNEYYEMYWDNRCTCGMSRAQRETSPVPTSNYTDSIDVPPPCDTEETNSKQPDEYAAHSHECYLRKYREGFCDCELSKETKGDQDGNG